MAVTLVISIILSVLAAGNSEKTARAGGKSGYAAVEIASSRHTRAESGKKAENYLSDLTGFEKKLENSVAEVWFNKDTASVRVVDKRSGYVWGSLKSSGDDDLNEEWTEVANSICTVEYYDENASERRAALSNAAVNAEYEWGGDTLNCSFDMNDGELGFSFTMKLQDSTLSFAVDENSVFESEGCLIKSLYFLPFFGCVREDETDGYMFVPDGPGALIRFSKSENYISPFQKKYYGMDYGIDTDSNNNDILSKRSNDFAVDTPQLSCPVYGVAHGAGQNAYLAEITSGAEYTVLTAYPAGFSTKFNRIGARFDYRQKYVKPTGQEGKGIESPQDMPNSLTPKISFTLLTGEDADYAGMARTYRERLTERGVLSAERSDKQLPLQVTLMGADVKKGFIKMGMEKLTDVNEAQQILSTLKEGGINNLSVVYSGWLKGGLSGSKYGTAAINSQLGSAADFKKLAANITDGGGRFYLNVNPITVTEKQISPAKLAATALGKDFEKIVRDNDEALFPEKYIVKPAKAASYAAKLLKKYDFNFCFEDVGTKLYSDSSRGEESDRVRTEEIFKKLAGIAGDKTAYFTPNSYVWENTGEYFGIPMVNSQYLYETDTVPFLQIVLKGSIDYYAPYANQGFYTDDSVLKMIEYGAYPSVILMAADNYSLHNTPLEDYFSLKYDSWKDVITDIYSRMQGALEGVEGETIEKHKVLKEGVVLVGYSNGTDIVINYNGDAVSTDYGTVEAKSYLVKRG